MKLSPKIRAALIAPALMIPLSGCASAGHFLARLVGYKPAAHMAEARPLYRGAADMPADTPTDRLYQAAAGKIEARDYGAALDLLQFAKEASPNDVRVLNALGVVYDKLGRFDLSDRYYTLALAAEPSSPIVAANMRYSGVMRQAMSIQRSERLLSPPVIELAMQEEDHAPSAPQGPLRALSGLRQIQPAGQPIQTGIRLAVATGTVRRSTPLVTGPALALVNATGRSYAAQPARLYLAQAGWSLAALDTAGPMQARSEIRFTARNQAAAEALARTLPFKVALAACSNECAFQLVLGRDAPAKFSGRAG